jgi:hypothetical protein
MMQSAPSVDAGRERLSMKDVMSAEDLFDRRDAYVLDPCLG